MLTSVAQHLAQAPAPIVLGLRYAALHRRQAQAISRNGWRDAQRKPLPRLRVREKRTKTPR